jgi:peroxiredoxin (alkyl hydroperoxide reductase subunit C)
VGAIRRQNDGRGSCAASAAPDEKEMTHMSILVGKEAPEFEASGLLDGKFGNFKLSEYRGKWVVLCFYPGDFTFV